MPLDPAGKIEYKEVSAIGAVRLQADPPVCNVCQQEITRKNFGFACVESNQRSLQRFEFIACTACTPMRASGDTLRRFVERHHL
jgi:hypothetical protein